MIEKLEAAAVITVGLLTSLAVIGGGLRWLVKSLIREELEDDDE